MKAQYLISGRVVCFISALVLGAGCAKVKSNPPVTTEAASQHQQGQDEVLSANEIRAQVSQYIEDTLRGQLSNLSEPATIQELNKIHPTAEYLAQFVSRGLSTQAPTQAIIDGFKSDLVQRVDEAFSSGPISLAKLNTLVVNAADQVILNHSGVGEENHSRVRKAVNGGYVTAAAVGGSLLSSTMATAALVRSHPDFIEAKIALSAASADDTAVALANLGNVIERIKQDLSPRLSRLSKESFSQRIESLSSGKYRVWRGVGNVFRVVSVGGAMYAGYQLIQLSENHRIWSPKNVNDLVLGTDGELHEVVREVNPRSKI